MYVYTSNISQNDIGNWSWLYIACVESQLPVIFVRRPCLDLRATLGYSCSLFRATGFSEVVVLATSQVYTVAS